MAENMSVPSCEEAIGRNDTSPRRGYAKNTKELERHAEEHDFDPMIPSNAPPPEPRAGFLSIPSRGERQTAQVTGGDNRLPDLVEVRGSILDAPPIPEEA